MSTIGKGSKVMWAGSWGKDTLQVMKIKNIDRTEKEHSKDGWGVDSVKWINGSWEFPFICDLSNGHWAYSYQVTPYTK